MPKFVIKLEVGVDSVKTARALESLIHSEAVTEMLRKSGGQIVSTSVVDRDPMDDGRETSGTQG